MLSITFLVIPKRYKVFVNYSSSLSLYSLQQWLLNAYNVVLLSLIDRFLIGPFSIIIYRRGINYDHVNKMRNCSLNDMYIYQLRFKFSSTMYWSICLVFHRFWNWFESIVQSGEVKTRCYILSWSPGVLYVFQNRICPCEEWCLSLIVWPLIQLGYFDIGFYRVMAFFVS